MNTSSTIATLSRLSGGVLLAVALVACGSSADAASQSATPAAATVQGSSPGADGGGGAGGAGAGGAGTGAGRAGGGQRPGTSGLIAAVDGSTMQVQSASAQTAVSWTGATTVTRQTKGALADVTVGSCVLASAAVAEQASGAAATSPSATPGAATAVTAGTVRITAAVNGECVAGFAGGRGGERPGGFPSGERPTGGYPGEEQPSGAMPSGAAPSGAAPSGAVPSGAPGGENRPGGGGFGQFVVGKVTAVKGDQVSVATTGQGGTAGTSTVTVDAATTYTKTVAAKASAIKQGLCATAMGKADTTGAVAATSIELSDPVDGSCTSAGFRGEGGFRGQGGGRPGAGSAPVTSNG